MEEQNLNIGEHLFPQVFVPPPKAIAALADHVTLQQLLAFQMQAKTEEILTILGQRKFEEAYGHLQSLLNLISLKQVINDAKAVGEEKKTKVESDPYKLRN